MAATTRGNGDPLPALGNAGGETLADRLLDVGRALVSELHTDAVLETILQEARKLTGARYAALGVLADDRRGLRRFLTAGLDARARREIGEPPRGRGVLGVLIDDPRPLRLADVSTHPRSVGFPPGHPPMHSFLGVPVLIRGEAWGNLYLAEKDGGEFTAADEEAVVALAQWAAVAIDNARKHEAGERHRDELARAVRSLEATQDIIYAIGGAAELSDVLDLIARQGRSLVGAASLVIMLRDGDALVTAAGAGRARVTPGQRIGVAESTAGEVLARGHTLRVTDVAAQLRTPPATFGVGHARTALLAPMLRRGEGIGILAAFDSGRAGREFADEDEQLLRAFAQAAANTVAIRRGVEADRLRAAIAAADAERARWARELHDETLQSLGGLRVLLASTIGRGGAVAKDEAMRQAVADIELEIANLREIIADLRPSLLDDLGLLPAIEALLDRRRDETLAIESELLPAGAAATLPPETETTVYRLVQEALSNVVKHAHASKARVTLRHERHEIVVEVRDDGAGFDVDAPARGFGLAGMRERVTLAGGTLRLESGGGGTRVCARLPLPGTHAAASPPGSASAASDTAGPR